MMTVKDILGQKMTPVWSVGAQDTVLDALAILESRDVGPWSSRTLSGGQWGLSRSATMPAKWSSKTKGQGKYWSRT